MNYPEYIRKSIPFFAHPTHNTLAYLDNAATTHMPSQVMDAMLNFMITMYAPIHRSLYDTAESATSAYENVRERSRAWINADDKSEIVFTSNATDAINMIAHAWAIPLLKPTDIILLSPLEHHANLLIWQYVAQVTGCSLQYIPVSPAGLLDMDAAYSLITSQVKLIAVTHNSNVLGTWVDVKQLAQWAHPRGAAILVDACQSAPRMQLNVQELLVDFLVFSAHKMMGPPGVGVLYCNKRRHKELVPYRRGGGMVHAVSYTDAQYARMPHLLEAGTPNSMAVIGFGAALEYLQQNIDFHWLRSHEIILCMYLHKHLTAMPHVRVISQQSEHMHMVTFVVDNIHAHDVAALLASEHIAVRAGNHCAHPLHTLLNIPATVRASVYAYTTQEECERLIQAVAAMAVE